MIESLYNNRSTLPRFKPKGLREVLPTNISLFHEPQEDAKKPTNLRKDPDVSSLLSLYLHTRVLSGSKRCRLQGQSWMEPHPHAYVLEIENPRPNDLRTSCVSGFPGDFCSGHGVGNDYLDALFIMDRIKIVDYDCADSVD